MTTPLDRTALELRDGIASGEHSAQEVCSAYLDRLASVEDDLGAFNEVYRDRALDEARDVDRRIAAGEDVGMLAGVPVAVKDNMCTDWGRTTCSSRMLEAFRSPYNATVVERLRSAGAVIVGKTNMDEFAMGSSTEHSAFRTTRNPWDTSRVPGGSSGGSASAVSARQCAAALGSDTGGSIRQPAAFCGVVGLKPTYGRVSRYGLVAFGSSLDQIGPVTWDVPDCALMLQAIAGHDVRDATSVPRDVEDYLSQLDRPVENLRLGLPREFFTDALGEEVRQAVMGVAGAMEQAGAELVEVSLPHSRIDRDAEGRLSSYAVATYYIVCMAEASSNLARYDGVHYGHRSSETGEDIVDLYSLSREEGFGEEVKRRVMLGTYTLSAGYYDAYYNKALKVRRLIRGDFQAALERCDVLLCPTTPTPAFEIGEKTADPLTMYLADIYTNSLNLAGLPGISIPAGLSSSNLPIGCQLIGGVFEEALLLRVARMCERTNGAERLAPPARAR